MSRSCRLCQDRSPQALGRHGRGRVSASPRGCVVEHGGEDRNHPCAVPRAAPALNNPLGGQVRSSGRCRCPSCRSSNRARSRRSISIAATVPDAAASADRRRKRGAGIDVEFLRSRRIGQVFARHSCARRKKPFARSPNCPMSLAHVDAGNVELDFRDSEQFRELIAREYQKYGMVVAKPALCRNDPDNGRAAAGRDLRRMTLSKPPSGMPARVHKPRDHRAPNALQRQKHEGVMRFIRSEANSPRWSKPSISPRRSLRTRWRRSMPAWTGMRCWCSTMRH